ncbi:RAD51-associated protein 1 isoform X1 [Callorhinchus milii]|uniref:RAD51-associated protein 1 n=1 Tax=Callorhinchus milii TaxID=7868 RepID=V9KWC5_CALMI|nr:RAD51-associated protein 1 isoform X1 [Callorhinchus milii]|eukprot:gi/632971820/ref/XP_007902358.1/ PREDICTED: RAD51-associated protein 1 isoform X1 [Callorhinchus milii]
MARPARSKRVVDYSQFGDFDDEDEDFACSSAPPSKKSRVKIKEVQQKKEKIITKPNSQETNKKPIQQRLPLDEKLYQRNLETAMVLSMQTSTGKVNEASSDKEGASINESPLLSNCTVDCNLLGLDKITNENEVPSVGCKQREAASKAASKQRQILLDDESSEGEKDDENALDYSPSSENNENVTSGDEDDQFIFKNQSNTNKKIRNETKLQTEKKGKTSIPKNSATVAPVASNPVRSKIQILPSLSEATPDSPPSSKPLSPSIGVTKLKWTPPATKESRTNLSATVSVKSPGQGLRLGLSRLARVKPLHPS